MAKFKCNQTGNIFSFEHEHDIKSMRQHPEYSEVVDIEPKIAFSNKEEPIKRVVGRPKSKE